MMQMHCKTHLRSMIVVTPVVPSLHSMMTVLEQHALHVHPVTVMPMVSAETLPQKNYLQNPEQPLCVRMALETAMTQTPQSFLEQCLMSLSVSALVL
jgi:hypothetical protein